MILGKMQQAYCNAIVIASLRAKLDKPDNELVGVMIITVGSIQSFMVQIM